MKKQFLIYMALAIIGVYGILGFFGVPYALTHIVPQKVHEATDGGKFSVQSASFNPFSFKLILHNLSFKTPQNGDFVEIRYFSMDVDPLDYLWKMGIVVDDLEIREPTISISKNKDGAMNFGWLVKEDENTSQEPSSNLALLIRNFTFKDGVLDYRDASEGKNYQQNIDEIGFRIENIDLRDMSTSKGVMRLYATINDGGFVDLRGKIASLKPFALEGSVSFDSGNLYTPWRYFKDKLPIEVADGKMDVSFDYALNSEDINATKLSNLKAGVSRLRIIPKGETKSLLALNSLKIESGSVWPMIKRFDAKSVRLNGMDAAASRGHDGEIDWIYYLDEIKKAFPEDENETKIPWSVSIEEVEFENMRIAWTDNGPKVPYSATLEGIALSSQRVSSDPKKVLNLQLKTGKMGAYRIADASAIAGFENLTVSKIALDREAQDALVDNVVLEGMNLSLKRQKDGSVDLKQLFYVSNKKEATRQEPSKPWSYRVNEMAVNNGRAGFLDEVPSPRVAINLDEVHVGVKNFSSNPHENIRIESSSRINKKTTLKTSSQLRRETLQSTGSFELRHFSLPLIDPYIEPSTHASLRRGDLGLRGTYSYTSEKMFVDGKLALDDWVVEDRRDDSVLLGWNRIGVTPFVYAYPENRLKVNHIAVDGLYANVLIDKNTTLNFSTLSKIKKSNAKGSKKTGNPFGLDVIKLSLLNSSATFSDLSLPLPFKTYTHDLSGEVLGISTTKDVTTFVKLRGGVDQYGLAKIDGNINTNAPKNFTNMRVAFENLELKQYTPYSLKFLGYKITDGKLFLNLGYKIDQGRLNSQNQIVIKKIELGDEQAGGSKWPMGLVVALLEDSDGVINIDLPVVGNVNNPDFKYGKVVWQVIGNLLTKAITAPFRLLGGMMGLEADDDSLSHISFEAGEDILLPPQREKLDKLATLLIKRPKLTLKVHGGWAVSEDERALRIQKLIKEVMGEPSKEGVISVEVMSLEALEKTAKKSIDSKEIKELRNAMKEKYVQEAEYTHHYTAALIEKLIPLQTLASSELTQLASKRSLAVVQYLHKTPDLANRVSASVSEAGVFDAKEGVASRLEVSVK